MPQYCTCISKAWATTTGACGLPTTVSVCSGRSPRLGPEKLPQWEVCTPLIESSPKGNKDPVQPKIKHFKRSFTQSHCGVIKHLCWLPAVAYEGTKCRVLDRKLKELEEIEHVFLSRKGFLLWKRLRKTNYRPLEKLKNLFSRKPIYLIYSGRCLCILGWGRASTSI